MQTSSKRVYHTKSRLGCGTCRQRRVKCDETRPTCSQCRKSKRECSGYPLEIRQSPSSRIELLQPHYFKNDFHRGDIGAVAKSIPPRIYSAPSSVAESSARDFFRTKTLTLLSGTLTSDMWTQEVLRLAEGAEEIKHCAIALGAWHAYKNNILVGNLQSLSQTWISRFCMAHYGLALRALQETLSKQGLNGSWRSVTLLTCLLLTLLESAFGNRTRANLHVKYGLSIARRAEKLGDASTFDVSVQFHLGQIGLSNQMLLVRAEDALQHFDLLQDVQLDQKAENTFAKCSYQVLNLGNNVYRFIFNLGVRLFPDAQTQNAVQAGLRDQVQIIRCNLEAESVRTGQNARVDILKARCELCRILIEACPSHYQSSYDEHFQSFKIIVDLVESALETHETNGVTFADMIGNLSMGLGIIPLLYYTAIYCRHGSIRRKAIALMNKGPKLEGIWNAKYTKAVANAVVDFEEKGALPGSTDLPGIIPEGSRIHLAFFETDQTVEKEDGKVKTIFATRPIATEPALTLSTRQISLGQ